MNEIHIYCDKELEMTTDSSIQYFKDKTMSSRILLFPWEPDGKTNTDSLKRIWKELGNRGKKITFDLIIQW